MERDRPRERWSRASGATTAELRRSVRRLLAGEEAAARLFRCVALILLEQGLGHRTVSAWFGVGERTLRRWQAVYRRHGPAGLEALGLRGRPARLSAEELRRLRATLRRPPAASGCGPGPWTGPRVRDWVRRACGKEISVRQGQRLLQALAPRP